MALRLFVTPALRSKISTPCVVSKHTAALFHTGRILSAHSTLALRAEATTKVDNSTVTFPPPSHIHGSYHWDFERFLSVGLIPLTTLQLTMGTHPITDLLVGVVLPLHCHIGVDAMISDYYPARRSPVMSKVLTWMLRVGTLGVLVGCYQFNTNDVGLTEVVKRVWEA